MAHTVTVTVDLALVGDMAGGDLQDAVGFYGRHGTISLLRGFRRSLLEPILLPICGIGQLSGEDRFVPARPGGGVPTPHAQRLLNRSAFGLETLRFSKRGLTDESGAYFRASKGGVDSYALWTNRLTRSSTVTIPVNLRLIIKDSRKRGMGGAQPANDAVGGFGFR